MLYLAVVRVVVLVVLIGGLWSVGYCKQPNIIFVLTDDQDLVLNSVDYMPNVQQLMIQEGANFVNHFATTALCCPNRAIILMGQYCHNTEIYDNGDLNNSTYLSGGFKKFKTIEDKTVAVRLQSLGYETCLIGKYLNGYGDSNVAHVPVGWSDWHGYTDLNYDGPHESNNGVLIEWDESVYQTDLILDEAVQFLQKRDTTKPFFLSLNPHAPHSPATPAKRHQGLFPDAIAPRTPSFNSDTSVMEQKPTWWIRSLPLLSSADISDLDNSYKKRLRCLQAVDEMILNLTVTLDQMGIADETYLFYMSDNGFHLGQFRLPGGKRQAYETDARIPFMVRGPGVTVGERKDVTLSIDLAATWLELAGDQNIPWSTLDGVSLVPLFETDERLSLRPYGGVVEMYSGSSNFDDSYTGTIDGHYYPNTFQALRVINGTGIFQNKNWLYAEWCTGETEFYDIDTDPWEMENTFEKLDEETINTLSATVEAIANCKGDSCRNPVIDPINHVRQPLVCHDPVTTTRNKLVFPFSDSNYVPHSIVKLHTELQDLEENGKLTQEQLNRYNTMLKLWNKH
ncbi:Arylsulfatase A [Pelomyxa schiedti]|nr:Arylsulfatase A [Pelomyxa schiedti]